VAFRVAHTSPGPLPPEELPDFLKLYLKDALSHDNEQKVIDDSIQAVKKRPHLKGLPPSLWSTSQGLNLTFFCAEKGKSIYKLDLTTWIKAAFQPLGGDFDEVLIADATGDVLFQKPSDLPPITDLKQLLLRGGSDSAQKTSKSSDGDNPAKQSSNNDVQSKSARAVLSPDVERFQRLSAASFFTDTTLGGRGYELFSVPVRVSLGNLSRETPWSLVVCGLRLSDQFESESHAIPYSHLIWAALIGAAIFSLSWPFAKLRYMRRAPRPLLAWRTLATS